MAALEQAVGRSVRDARKRAGLTQEQLAQKIRVETTTLSRYETARRPFSLEMLERVAEALDVTVGSLIDDRSAVPELSKDEEGLVRTYRGLSARQRRIALWLVRELHRVK
jgi:transcriptional regulator with XRE-family HTH domain